MRVVFKILPGLSLLMLASSSYAQPDFLAKKGILNAHEFDFTLSTLELNGEWNFYWDQLLAPFELPVEKAEVVNFPSTWSSSQGFATYNLKLILNPKFKDYAIRLPTAYSSYALWVNGNLIAKNGIVATSRKEARAQYLPTVVNLPATKDTLSLVLQISNFSHYLGGIKDPLVVGLSDDLMGKKNLGQLVNTVLVGLLAFIGLLFLNIYMFVKKEKSILFFAMVCMVWGVRSLFAEDYLAIHWMPWFDWELTAKIEYMTIYLLMIFAMLFITTLYPLDVNKRIKQLLLIPNYLFIAFTMSTYAIVFTRFLNVYLIFAGLVILYIVFVILRAIVFERYGAWFSVLGIFAGITAFAYNILTYERVFEFNPIFFYSSWLMIVVFMSIALIYQLSPTAKKFNTTETLTWEDVMSSR